MGSLFVPKTGAPSVVTIVCVLSTGMNRLME